MKTTSITFLLPFDIGRSYILPVNFDWAAKLETLPEDDDVRLSAHQFPDDVRAPLGKPLRMEIVDGPARKAVDKAIKRTTWCRDARVEVIFFPIGIAVLIVRAELGVPTGEAWHCFKEWEKGAYASFAPIGELARDHFTSLATRLKLPEIKDTARTPKEYDYPWIYPLFFTDGSAKIDEAAHLECIKTANVEVFVRWRSSQVESPPLSAGNAQATRHFVESFYIIASVVWEMLNVTDTLLDTRLQELAHAQVTARVSALARMQSVRLLRAFCARALDGSHALRWTVDQDALKLLNAIHSAWDTGRWSGAVQNKLELLVLFYEQNEADLRERQNFALAAVALVIALVSTVSACSDILNVIDPSSEMIKGRLTRAGLMLSLPLLGGMLTVFFLRRRKQH